MNKNALLATASVVFALGAAAVVAPAGQAQIFGGEIDVQLDADGDESLAGGDIEVAGRVGGTLRLAGADVMVRDAELGRIDAAAADFEFSGSVEDGGSVNAADVRWDGRSGGDLRINAADLHFDGEIDGALEANIADGELDGRFASLRINAADLSIGRDAVVEGDARVNAAELELDGAVEGELDASARTIRIAGEAGELVLNADPGRRPRRDTDGLVDISGSVGGGSICARTVSISGEVSGPLEIMADSEPDLSGGASDADIDYTPRDGRRCER